MNAPGGLKREHTSVVLVFAGFAVLVLVFRGVWGRAFHALVTGKSASSTGSGASATPASSGSVTAQAVRLMPGSFALEYPTPASGALPGSAPAPARATAGVAGPSYVPHPIVLASGRTVVGQLTEGEKGETESFTSADQIAALGGGVFQGPGRYTRVKEPPTVAGGGPNTIWEYAGA